MKAPIFLFAVALGLSFASCSKEKDAGRAEQHTTADQPRETEVAGESEAAPEPSEIGEDCVAFLRSTRAVPTKPSGGECVGCSTTTDAPEVLKFGDFKIENVTTTENGCTVDVVLHAQFNRSAGGTIVGGLVGWIPPEQRTAYAAGKTPEGTQSYHVRVTYNRSEGFWKPVDFDRIP